jgi:hypothetical protein
MLVQELIDVLKASGRFLAKLPKPSLKPTPGLIVSLETDVT